MFWNPSAAGSKTSSKTRFRSTGSTQSTISWYNSCTAYITLTLVEDGTVFLVKAGIDPTKVKSSSWTIFSATWCFFNQHRWNSEWRTSRGRQTIPNSSAPLSLGQGWHQGIRAHSWRTRVPTWDAHCTYQNWPCGCHRGVGDTKGSSCHWFLLSNWCKQWNLYTISNRFL